MKKCSHVVMITSFKYRHQCYTLLRFALTVNNSKFLVRDCIKTMALVGLKEPRNL